MQRSGGTKNPQNHYMRKNQSSRPSFSHESFRHNSDNPYSFTRDEGLFAGEKFAEHAGRLQYLRDAPLSQQKRRVLNSVPATAGEGKPDYDSSRRGRRNDRVRGRPASAARGGRR